jgi:hypothetical protein
VNDAQQPVALDAALLRRLSSYWFFTSHPAIIAATRNAHQAQIKPEYEPISERCMTMGALDEFNPPRNRAKA